MAKVFKQKICGGCKRRFVPTGSAHKWCSVDCHVWAYSDKSRGPHACWEWTKSKFKCGGYGKINTSQRHRLQPQRAHRLAWESVNGKIPRGLNALHTCDNPPCCNPAHMYLGTHQDNSDDKHRRGRDRKRGLRGEESPKCKLTAKKVLAIRKSTETFNKIAEKYGISHSSVQKIRYRVNWKHLP